LEPDPKARPVATHARVRDRLRSLRLVLGLVLLIGLSALIGASATATPRTVHLHVGLWFFGQCATIAGAVASLRLLRRRRFGALPSTRLPRTSDGLVYIAATVGGALALTAFAPRLIGTASGLDWIIVGLGLVLLAAGLRGAALYLLRP